MTRERTESPVPMAALQSAYVHIEVYAHLHTQHFTR